MAKGRREVPPCCRNYGLPLFCARWIPLDRISPSAAEAQEEPSASSAAADGTEPIPPPAAGSQLFLVLGGSGGDGRSSVPSALLLSQFDFPSRSLSDQPLHRLDTEDEVPYRMAVHPGGDGIVCSFPKSCRLFKWDLPTSKDGEKLTLKPSGRAVMQLEDPGLQLALAFNAEGSMLAAGGEDGYLRVFKWPSMDIVLDTYAPARDLHFSSDAKFLVSLGFRDPCMVWDMTSSTVVASLPRKDGEIFGFCRFSQNINNDQILYVTSVRGGQLRIVSWNNRSWERVESKRIVCHPVSVSAFSVSTTGTHLAVGTIEGDIVIVNSAMQVQTIVKKAHLGVITALEFSRDSRALVSASFDSTVLVTLVEGSKSNGLNMRLILLVILLAILVYFMMLNEADAPERVFTYLRR